MQVKTYLRLDGLLYVDLAAPIILPPLLGIARLRLDGLTLPTWDCLTFLIGTPIAEEPCERLAYWTDLWSFILLT